mmetsp:Transcript_99840/g.223794  ORF Transcript_99840/g.223794 Transcript_99840/m.223794 type:complete len:253 (+) Transcript_99840:340-1098(+)
MHPCRPSRSPLQPCRPSRRRNWRSCTRTGPRATCSRRSPAAALAGTRPLKAWSTSTRPSRPRQTNCSPCSTGCRRRSCRSPSRASARSCRGRAWQCGCPWWPRRCSWGHCCTPCKPWPGWSRSSKHGGSCKPSRPRSKCRGATGSSPACTAAPNCRGPWTSRPGMAASICPQSSRAAACRCSGSGSCRPSWCHSGPAAGRASGSLWRSGRGSPSRRRSRGCPSTGASAPGPCRRRARGCTADRARTGRRPRA